MKNLHQEIAIDFLATEPHTTGLIWCTGWICFYLYDEGVYTQLIRADMRKKVYEFIKPNFDINITMGLIDDIIEHLKLVCPRKFDNLYTDYIALNDKVLD